MKRAALYLAALLAIAGLVLMGLVADAMFYAGMQ